MAAKTDLVIVESPSKAKTIGKYLGPGYEVKASMGHVRDLPKSKIGVDIEGGFVPQYQPIKGKEDVISDLKKAAKKSGRVYLATDPDREGEAISWHLKELLDIPDDKTYRVTFNEITKKVVNDSIAAPRAIDQILVDVPQARRILDRIVGYELSPLLWRKIRRGLSAGRVQSVATRLVAEREEEIRAFVTKEYWSIDAKLTAPPSKAVFAAKQGEEDKVFSGLARLMEEDPSIKLEKNVETTETLLSGQGELHLDVIRNKLASKFGANAVLQDPRIPYRETIKKTVKVQGRHKKQSGGHGQFGDVWIEFSPIGDTSIDFEFEDAVVGGVVPRNFIPSVEKGLRENIRKGVLAGYPMVGLHAKLYDGSYHPVDSSEMAFKTAARIAYKKGCMEANPVLLEPIMHVEVYVPDEYMGDVMGDMNKRRGRIMGMNQVDGMQQLVAEAPQAEMFKYATDLRSMTQARGWFTMSFERYEEVPSNVAQKVIEEAKAEAGE